MIKMITLQKVIEDVQKSNPVQLEEIQVLLQKQKRERLKAAAQALATSTEEEQVFLENVQSRPWSSRAYKTRVITPKITMQYWKEEDFWLGQIESHPQLVTQGRTLLELQEMVLDLYQLMVEDERNGMNAFYEALRTHNYPCKMRFGGDNQ